MVMRSSILAAALVFLCACNVSDPPAPTGGAHFEAGACGRGLAVVCSDYASTNVALTSLEGEVQSPSVLSSGATAPGISMALSADVVLPTESPLSGRLVLIDRYPNAVLTWLDPESGSVLGQMSVATGFASNPQDYIELDSERAYVSRYGTNLASGSQPFDQGGDLLVINSKSHQILGRIDLTQPGDEDLLPRASRLIRLGQQIVVVLQRFNANYTKAGDGRLIGIDPTTDKVAWQLELPGISNCGAMVVSPSGKQLLVSCTGGFYEKQGQVEQSALVLLDASQTPPKEIRRYQVASQLGEPLSPALGFVSENLVLGTSWGNLGVGLHDKAYSVALDSGAVTVLSEASTAFVYGDIRCESQCGEPCLLADGEKVTLRRWLGAQSGLQALTPISMKNGVGLPPRSLGGF